MALNKTITATLMLGLPLLSHILHLALSLALRLSPCHFLCSMGLSPPLYFPQLCFLLHISHSVTVFTAWACLASHVLSVLSLVSALSLSATVSVVGKGGRSLSLCCRSSRVEICLLTPSALGRAGPKATFSGGRQATAGVKDEVSQ